MVSVSSVAWSLCMCIVVDVFVCVYVVYVFVWWVCLCLCVCCCVQQKSTSGFSHPVGSGTYWSELND